MEGFMEPLVRTAEAARISGFSRSFLYHRHKEIPAVRRIGRNLRWDIPVLLAWMESQAKATAANGSNGTGDHDG